MYCIHLCKLSNLAVNFLTSRNLNLERKWQNSNASMMNTTSGLQFRTLQYLYINVPRSAHFGLFRVLLFWIFDGNFNVCWCTALWMMLVNLVNNFISKYFNLFCCTFFDWNFLTLGFLCRLSFSMFCEIAGDASITPNTLKGWFTEPPERVIVVDWLIREVAIIGQSNDVFLDRKKMS